MLDKEIPHLAAAITALRRGSGVPTAVLSRGLAGVAGRTSDRQPAGVAGGAKDGMAVLTPLLRHAVDQVRGGDHSTRVD